MTHPLVRHALKNVWCNPNQDRQYLFAPARLTPLTGARLRYRILQSWIALPTPSDRYHLFQIGCCGTDFMALISPQDRQRTWLPLSDLINDSTVYAECYTPEGRQLPRCSVYYTFTDQDNLILAVQELKQFVDVYPQALYFRFYQNGYYASPRHVSVTRPLYCRVMDCTHPGDMLTFQAEYERWVAQPGYTTGWVNGYWVPQLSLLTMQLGDYVEFVYDSSVFQTLEYRLVDLPGYVSRLDRKRKYLVHTPKQPTAMIRYHDDIEIYVIDQTTGRAVRGCYYHRNDPAAVRMVTHQDYGLPVDTVQYFLRVLQGSSGLELDQVRIRLHVRNSGYERPLVYETNGIHELYKLDDPAIVDAMTGVYATVPYWQAGHLEASGYTAIMQNLEAAITPALVEAAYGYRAMSVLIGQTPQAIDWEETHGLTPLPEALWEQCTVYEYDAKGYLINVVGHANNSLYLPEYRTCETIEAWYGKGTYQPYTAYGIDAVALPAYGHYRIYRGVRTAEGWTGPWVDITATAEYQVVDGRAVWVGEVPNQILCVRSDQDFLCYDLAWVPVDGCLRFTLSAMEDRGDGIKHHTLLVPYGNIDLFLNGRALIEGLDYTVRFPDIVIVNKAYLTIDPNTTEQRIHVRCSGFVRPDLTREPPAEVGFVMHGALSMNRRYDVRETKVARIVVDGALKRRDQVRFAEELLTRDPLAVMNGKPYAIEEIIVPMEPLTAHDTYHLRALAQGVDEAIGNYLTLHLPEPSLGLSSISEQYAIVSPFLCKLIFQLYHEAIPSVDLIPELTDAQVLALCQPYEEWLAFDPIRAEQRPDLRYVTIHPLNIDRTISLNLYQYRFIHKVVRLYCPNLVDLSSFITLDPHRSLP